MPNNIKALILDKIHQDGINLLKTFAEVDYGWNYTIPEIKQEIAKYQIIVIKSNNHITREIIQNAKNLKIIGRAGSGTDNIDLTAARERGIKIITSSTGNAISVAEFILGIIFMMTHKILESHLGAKKNDFRRDTWRGRNLSNMTVGVLGLGGIGRCLVKKLENLSFKTYGYDYKNRSNNLDNVSNFELCHDLNFFFKNIDILSINIPLSENTTNFISEKEFNLMKPGLILINTARGKIIDEAALKQAIKNGIVDRAALDVLSQEPPFHIDPLECSYSHPLVNHPKIFYTPHIAAGTSDALSEVAVNMIEKIKKEIFSNE